MRTRSTSLLKNETQQTSISLPQSLSSHWGLAVNNPKYSKSHAKAFTHKSMPCSIISENVLNSHSPSAIISCYPKLSIVNNVTSAIRSAEHPHSTYNVSLIKAILITTKQALRTFFYVTMRKPRKSLHYKNSPVI